MAAARIRHVDFRTLITINKEVVSLTMEPHEYTEEDEKKIRSLLQEVESAHNSEDLEEAVGRKTALLVFRIATGQYFHEGNKRTALVAALAFLHMNGFSIDIKNKELLSVVDKAGIARATLNETYDVVRRLISDVSKGA